MQQNMATTRITTNETFYNIAPDETSDPFFDEQGAAELDRQAVGGSSLMAPTESDDLET